MLLVILEAMAAFFIFIFIVWWTMFSGAKPSYHAEGQQRAAEDDAAQ